MRFVQLDLAHTGQQCSATEYHRVKADVRRVLALAPHEVGLTASFAMRLFLLFSFAARDRYSLYERVRSKVTPRHTG